MRLTPLALTGAFALTLASPEAHATSCGPCGWLESPDDLDALPENFALRFAASLGQIRPSAPILAGPGTSTITLSCRPITHLASERHVCSPAEPLVGGTWYDLQFEAWFGGRAVRVTAPPDRTAPDAPSLLALTRIDDQQISKFGPGARGFRLEVTTPEPTGLVTFEVGVTPSGGTESIYSGAATPLPSGAIEVYVGSGGCSCGDVPSVARELDATIRVRVVDAAQNLGAWSSPLVADPLPPLDEDDGEVGGCVCVGGARTKGGLGLLALAFAGIVMRGRGRNRARN